MKLIDDVSLTDDVTLPSSKKEVRMKFMIVVLLVWICASLLVMYGEIKEIKHMVNEVVCEALEMEETWATATGIN